MLDFGFISASDGGQPVADQAAGGGKTARPVLVDFAALLALVAGTTPAAGPEPDAAPADDRFLGGDPPTAEAEAEQEAAQDGGLPDAERPTTAGGDLDRTAFEPSGRIADRLVHAARRAGGQTRPITMRAEGGPDPLPERTPGRSDSSTDTTAVDTPVFGAMPAEGQGSPPPSDWSVTGLGDRPTGGEGVRPAGAPEPPRHGSTGRSDRATDVGPESPDLTSILSRRPSHAGAPDSAAESIVADGEVIGDGPPVAGVRRTMRAAAGDQADDVTPSTRGFASAEHLSRAVDRAAAEAVADEPAAMGTRPRAWTLPGAPERDGLGAGSQAPPVGAEVPRDHVERPRGGQWPIAMDTPAPTARTPEMRGFEPALPSGDDGLPAVPSGTPAPTVAPPLSAPAHATAVLGAEPPQVRTAADAGLPFAATPDEAGETAGALVRAIRLQWANGTGEARIQLEPEQFGTLSVTLKIVDGHVQAHVRADTAVVREWLQANHQMLANGLADRDLTLERIEVSEAHDADESDLERDARDGQEQARDRQREPRRRARAMARGATFEVIV